MGKKYAFESSVLYELHGDGCIRGKDPGTKGIWIAKAVGIEPFTIIMDLEGTDGRERGEDDTVFKKQNALFALAVAGIVLINMVTFWNFTHHHQHRHRSMLRLPDID
ncbi:hypothetical protein OROGR_000867 [Orobanche gracilis]